MERDELSRGVRSLARMLLQGHRYPSSDPRKGMRGLMAHHVEALVPLVSDLAIMARTDPARFDDEVREGLLADDVDRATRPERAS